MIKIYGSDTDVALRVLILLSVVNYAMTVDRMVFCDFIVTYGGYFGISEDNLHGDNEYGFGELAVRRKTMIRSIKYLVLQGLIRTVECDEGFSYEITDAGNEAAARFSSEYAKEYRNTAMKVFDAWGGSSDDELRDRIDRCSRGLRDYEGR